MSGEKVVANSELLLFIEQTPDTILTFRDGQKLFVKEKPDEVVRMALDFARMARAPWSSKGAS